MRIARGLEVHYYSFNWLWQYSSSSGWHSVFYGDSRPLAKWQAPNVSSVSSLTSRRRWSTEISLPESCPRQQVIRSVVVNSSLTSITTSSLLSSSQPWRLPWSSCTRNLPIQISLKRIRSRKSLRMMKVLHIKRWIRLWTRSFNANSNYSNGEIELLASALTNQKYLLVLPRRDLHSRIVVVIARLRISGSRGKTILMKLSSLPVLPPCPRTGPMVDLEGKW